MHTPGQPYAAGRAFAVLGTALQVVALAAVVFAGIDIWPRFRAATGDAESAAGELLGDFVGAVVVWSLIGLGGLLISLFTVARSQYRARWFFWVSLAFASGFLFILPFGTLVSLVFIVYLIVKRREFLDPVRNSGTADK